MDCSRPYTHVLSKSEEGVIIGQRQRIKPNYSVSFLEGVVVAQAAKVVERGVYYHFRPAMTVSSSVAGSIFCGKQNSSRLQPYLVEQVVFRNVAFRKQKQGST